MSSMFTIPEKGSPLDIARDISSNESVLDAVEDLISQLESVAIAQGLTKNEVKEAVSGSLNDLRAIIDAAIESGFEHVLSRRV